MLSILNLFDGFSYYFMICIFDCYKLSRLDFFKFILIINRYFVSFYQRLFLEKRLKSEICSCLIFYLRFIYYNFIKSVRSNSGFIFFFYFSFFIF
nr:MAG TPA: hypothetical protein [Caudoviricetes sp.]